MVFTLWREGNYNKLHGPGITVIMGVLFTPHQKNGRIARPQTLTYMMPHCPTRKGRNALWGFTDTARKKHLQVVAALVVLGKIQSFGLLFFAHAQPDHRIQHFENDEGDHRAIHHGDGDALELDQ